MAEERGDERTPAVLANLRRERAGNQLHPEQPAEVGVLPKRSMAPNLIRGALSEASE